MKGIKRFRQAIKNQRDAGEGEFRLTYGAAEEIAAEIEKEFESLSWAAGVPAPKDADGEVVPLTTKAMYTDRGQKIELGEFYMLHSVLRDGSVWRAMRHIGNHIEDWKLDCLHLRCPDSWERLEEDAAKGICDYFDHSSCLKCPGFNHASHSCDKARAQDIVRRAKALAERDVKEAGRG